MKKILVVEDNAVVAGVYRAKLQAEGFQVEVAADGQAGLEMIERTRPDLVLLDLILPKMTDERPFTSIAGASWRLRELHDVNRREDL